MRSLRKSSMHDGRRGRRGKDGNGLAQSRLVSGLDITYGMMLLPRAAVCAGSLRFESQPIRGTRSAGCVESKPNHSARAHELLVVPFPPHAESTPLLTITSPNAPTHARFVT